jgi:hypothetical protein
MMMDKTGKKAFKILGVIAVVIVAIPILLGGFVLFMNWKDTWGHDCEQGPLVSISKCSYDQSSESWMNSGWWHSDATGILDDASCKIITDGEDQLPFVEMNGQEAVPTSVYKVSCENFGQGITGTCYASQRMAVNGNSRYVKILIANGCNDVRYFEGSKYTIQDGKAAEYNWSTPIQDIPDEKTGKVEATRVYGEIQRKSGLCERT